MTLMRDGELIPNPKSSLVFRSGDRIGIIGEPEQFDAAETLIAGVLDLALP